MSKKKRNPFLKKRYIPLYLLLVVMLFAHGCLSFRVSDEDWKKTLADKGQIEPTIHNYQVEDRNMHYIHVGNDTLPLFIFIHGTPGSSNGFEDYLADTMLTNHIQMISVDRPGFGYSDYGKPAESLAQQSIYLKPILERHKNASKIYIVGHSLGGPVIARMAMDYEELMDGLIMLAPSIAPELEPYEWYRKPMNWRGLRWAIPTVFRVSNQEILPVKGNLTEMLPLWKNITIPVIVMQGEKDVLVPKENAFFAKKMLINSERVDIHMLPEENHFIVWSKYDEIVKLIMKEVD
jgi:pimeloyl-ACP methyl ester carboxylesterase